MREVGGKPGGRYNKLGRVELVMLQEKQSIDKYKACAETSKLRKRFAYRGGRQVLSPPPAVPVEEELWAHRLTPHHNVGALLHGPGRSALTGLMACAPWSVLR